MQSPRPRNRPTPPPASQRNPGTNWLPGDERRQAALDVLRQYYRAVELRLAPVD